MRDRLGAIGSICACALFLAVLAWPYVARPPSAITTYYSWGILNPLFAGVLVALIPIVFAVYRTGRLSPQLGSGIVLVLGLFSVALTAAWAVTARLDVFRAPGWAVTRTAIRPGRDRHPRRSLSHRQYRLSQGG